MMLVYDLYMTRDSFQLSLKLLEMNDFNTYLT